MTPQTQNQHLQIGLVNRLKVVRESDHGLYLAANDETDVLLPKSYVVQSQMPIGALVDVFIYTDSEDRPVATTQRPYAMLGEYGYS